jgi:prepilin-type N-terminal cleavage/methylation domain-containing protein
MKKGDFNLRGFTIIEVTLVLAIAGLIFLMIFIALPALQRQQRDTARKEDITAFISAVKKYQTNNRGALPNDDSASTSWDKFVDDYMNDGFEDPSTGEEYELVVELCNGRGKDTDCATNDNWQKVLNGTFAENAGNIYVITQAKCAGDESKGVISTANTRKVAVLYRLEGSGLYCENT